MSIVLIVLAFFKIVEEGGPLILGFSEFHFEVLKMGQPLQRILFIISSQRYYYSRAMVVWSRDNNSPF